MTPEQLQLLNRRISEQRGWTVDYDANEGYRLRDNHSLITSAFGSVLGFKTQEAAWKRVPDWCGDDHASCVLLDHVVSRLLEYRVLSVGAQRRLDIAIEYARLEGISLEGVFDAT